MDRSHLAPLILAVLEAVLYYQLLSCLVQSEREHAADLTPSGKLEPEGGGCVGTDKQEERTMLTTEIGWIVERIAHNR